jgi:hypothetical protein
LLDLELREFLDREEMPEEVKKEAYHQEFARINYNFLL